MRIVAIALPLLALILGACGGTTGTAGTNSPSPVTTPTASAGAPPTATAAASESPTSPATEEPAMPLTLSSTAFAEGGAIPREHTCDGADVSPPLAWTGLPGGTAGLALIVDDPDAGGFIHWVAFDIQPASGGLAAGASTAGDAPSQGRNDFGDTGYGGPCPPSGTHRYAFRLLALDGQLGLSGTPRAGEVFAAAGGHVLAEVTLTGTYRRGG